MKIGDPIAKSLQLRGLEANPKGKARSSNSQARSLVRVPKAQQEQGQEKASVAEVTGEAFIDFTEGAPAIDSSPIRDPTFIERQGRNQGSSAKSKKTRSPKKRTEEPDDPVEASQRLRMKYTKSDSQKISHALAQQLGMPIPRPHG